MTTSISVKYWLLWFDFHIKFSKHLQHLRAVDKSNWLKEANTPTARAPSPLHTVIMIYHRSVFIVYGFKQLITCQERMSQIFATQETEKGRSMTFKTKVRSIENIACMLLPHTLKSLFPKVLPYEKKKKTLKCVLPQHWCMKFLLNFLLLCQYWGREVNRGRTVACCC